MLPTFPLLRGLPPVHPFAEVERLSRILRIAVNANPLAIPKSGIGRYTSNLLRELAAQRSPHRIFLYSDRPFQLQFPMPEHWKVRVRQLHVPRFRTIFQEALFAAWARRDKIDVFWSPTARLPVLLPSHVRKILTVHDMVWKRFPETMPRRGHTVDRLLLSRSFRIADHVIADSKFTRSEILVFFPDTRCEINVVYLASNLRAEGATGSCPVSGPYFLFVGSKEPRKNLRRLLEAYLQYRTNSSLPIDLVIAGSCEWGDFSVNKFILANDLHASVHVIENADDTVLRALYANAHALVMVALYEGFGLPLVEAMQWNLPLIASNNSAVAEIAGDAALLVDPCDVDAIAEALRRMEEDSAIRSELALLSGIRGMQFSWKQAAAETMALILGSPTDAKYRERA
jgi:glycosyltransferase involved in cell wall biosynthesis